MSNPDLTLPENLDRRKNKDVAQTKAGKAAAKVHSADQGETIAQRIKDASMLEKALLEKLNAQKDFAREYKSLFKHGGDRKSDQVASTGHLKSAETWCQSHGFAWRVVRRWTELLDDSVFNAKKNDILDRCWKLAELWQAANYSSESVEWYTPARYLEAAREVLGGIDLDPASNERANATVQAKEFFSAEDDGLEQEWHGRIFLNPPYGKTKDGKSMAGEFCNKAVEEYESGNVKAGIILVNSVHSQDWQAPLYRYPVCFVDHRIQFVSGSGDTNKNPTFQNIFVYLGTERRKFAAAFSRFGYVMERVDA